MAEEKRSTHEEGQKLPVRSEERGIRPSEESFFESPFQLMRKFRDEMDRMFSEFGFPSMMVSPFERIRSMIPAVDVWETDQDVKVRADLPGIEPENLEIYTTDDSLSIRAESKKEEEARERGYYRAERRYGRFERTIDLPANVKPDQAKAAFKNGVLEITLPKTEQAKERMKRIPVETEEEQMTGTKGGKSERGKK
ncbi:MAG: Hsp20/alpha crystallin family protein [Armatimonadota bacterium]